MTFFVYTPCSKDREISNYEIFIQNSEEIFKYLERVSTSASGAPTAALTGARAPGRLRERAAERRGAGAGRGGLGVGSDQGTGSQTGPDRRVVPVR